MRSIMLALSGAGHFVFRCNVGLFYTKDGRPVRAGLPTGFSDLAGHRAGDARAFYIEVKSQNGHVSTEQRDFINAMQKRGALSGVARSVSDALDIVSGRSI
ncbi:MAG: VRR-NUC domain-containing protein [Betaproteobacteria bacterium]